MGGQKGIASFYKSFSKLLAVTIVSTKNNENSGGLDAEFLPVLSNSQTRYCNPFLFFTIKKIIRKRKSSHLILEHPYYGWLGILIKWLLKTKLIIHSHNIESLRFKSTGKWWWSILWQYEKFTHRCADINFFITDEDRKYAIDHFKLIPEKCHTITYGFDLSAPPSDDEKRESKLLLQQEYDIPKENKILLFNGTLDYKPNLDALNNILNYINPILLKNETFHYTILICGKGLPSSYDNLIEHRKNNIIFAGFVDDITIYFKGADIFLNPVIDGGGIKTKLVEALGYNLCCISTVEGAIGVPQNVCGNKLKIINKVSWNEFANSIMNTSSEGGKVGKEFFDHFFWDKIAENAVNEIMK